MFQFRRAVRLVLLLSGLLAGLVGAVAAVYLRLLLNPPRRPLWTTPHESGLDYDDVHFPARDGVRLSGWFIPAGHAPGPAVVLLHGWPWNRLGANGAGGPLLALLGRQPVELLRLAQALHRAGYHVLTLDLRNHGRSAAARPVTFGWQESRDLLGALDYLAGRPDVRPGSVGVVGFSMGANAVLFTLPQTDRIGAAVAVQPTSPAVFSRRYGRQVMGWLSTLVTPLVELVYRAAGGLRFAAIEPLFAAAGAGDVPVLYVQGTGDPWGSVDNVAQIAAVTPRPSGPLLVATNDRFGGYQYVTDHPEVVVDFLRQNLS